MTVGKPPGKNQNSSAAALVSDIGIVKKGTSKRDSSNASGASTGASGGDKNNFSDSPSMLLEDSFEKYYNKDLDLEEDQVPVVINELNESALNFISQE